MGLPEEDCRNNDPFCSKFHFLSVPYHEIMKTETEPDDNKLHHLFRKFGMDEDGALTAVQEIRTMAGQNILAKMDVQSAKMETQYAKIETELRNIHRIIGYSGVGIGLFFSALHIAIYAINK